jgi:hypothetical protein
VKIALFCALGAGYCTCEALHDMAEGRTIFACINTALAVMNVISSLGIYITQLRT